MALKVLNPKPTLSSTRAWHRVGGARGGVAGGGLREMP